MMTTWLARVKKKKVEPATTPPLSSVAWCSWKREWRGRSRAAGAPYETGCIRARKAAKQAKIRRREGKSSLCSSVLLFCALQRPPAGTTTTSSRRGSRSISCRSTFAHSFQSMCNNMVPRASRRLDLNYKTKTITQTMILQKLTETLTNCSRSWTITNKWSRESSTPSPEPRVLREQSVMKGRRRWQKKLIESECYFLTNTWP